MMHTTVEQMARKCFDAPVAAADAADGVPREGGANVEAGVAIFEGFRNLVAQGEGKPMTSGTQCGWIAGSSDTGTAGLFADSDWAGSGRKIEGADQTAGAQGGGGGGGGSGFRNPSSGERISASMCIGSGNF